MRPHQIPHHLLIKLIPVLIVHQIQIALDITKVIGKETNHMGKDYTKKKMERFTLAIFIMAYIMVKEDLPQNQVILLKEHFIVVQLMEKFISFLRKRNIMSLLKIMMIMMKT